MENSLYRVTKASDDLDAIAKRMTELLKDLKSEDRSYFEKEIECYRDISVAMRINSLAKFKMGLNKLTRISKEHIQFDRRNEP